MRDDLGSGIWFELNREKANYKVNCSAQDMETNRTDLPNQGHSRSVSGASSNDSEASETGVDDEVDGSSDEEPIAYSRSTQPNRSERKISSSVEYVKPKSEVSLKGLTSVSGFSAAHRSGNDRRVCHSCGEKGHIQKECPRRESNVRREIALAVCTIRLN